MRNHPWIHRLTFVLVLLLAAGCSTAPSAPGYGTMRVRMTDAPGDFESVNLVVTQVAAHIAGSEAPAGAMADSDGSGADTTSGWVVLNDTPATYDLLTLQNGVFTTLGSARVPAGHYTQVRLKLGAGSNVVVGGVTHPLIVPSGLQTGLKLVGEFDVPDNGLLDIALDFDAARSILLTGAGDYHLKPTVKVLPFTTAGAITGAVSPAGTETAVYAIQDPDTLGTAMAGADGHFTLGVLAPGTYSVALHPASGYRDTTLTGVSVPPGATTDVGTIELTAE
jgi:hypothetical protein